MLKNRNVTCVTFPSLPVTRLTQLANEIDPESASESRDVVMAEVR